jgi:uncharacterized membrane protein YfcA
LTHLVRVLPTLYETAVGFGSNFLDALGVGSFATTTAAWKARNTIPDEKIPGTLNVGHAAPTIVEALIFIRIVKVDTVTLVALILSATMGAWLGAGIVGGWPRRRVQRGMAIALLITAAIIVLRQLKFFPGGGDALGLTGPLLVAGIVGNAILGALMTLGVGLYAPCMGMVYLLGMTPLAAFPIMMGSCAVLMPIASIRFAKAKAYDKRAALGLAIGGIPGVIIAAFLVKSLPLDVVRWLVVGVILYTAISMWRSSLGSTDQVVAEVATP